MITNEAEDVGRDSNTYQQFRVVDERIVNGVKEVMGDITEETRHG